MLSRFNYLSDIPGTISKAPGCWINQCVKAVHVHVLTTGNGKGGVEFYDFFNIRDNQFKLIGASLGKGMGEVRFVGVLLLAINLPGVENIR